MATVKLEPVRGLKAYDEYVSKGRESEICETGPEGLEGQMQQAIEDEHARAKNKRVEHEAITLYQSWKVEESGMFPIEKYNQMGRELAERWAPGHLAWVVTHTDTDKTHNHITICSVHSETGKAISRKKADLERMHEINNSIALENGLALNKRRVNDIYAKLPDHVRKAVAGGRQSWLFDMVEKIDFARSASTTFDEYRGQLKTLGVDVQIENKNITYFYGENKKKRGKALGTLFDKEGLIKTFKENDEKFAKHPDLRSRILSDIGAAFDGKGNPLGTPSDLLLKSASHPGLRNKDYGKFTKVHRDLSRRELPAIFDERGGLLYGEMKKAQQVSILDYCDAHKIKTKQNEKGQTVLHGKEFVVLSPSSWTNTKNKTTGTIIDFVAIHDESNFLRAVAKINSNPRLLLLEQVIGEYKRNYRSFYIPKPKAAQAPHASEILTKFLNAKGIRGERAKTFLGNKNVHIGVDKSVWLMGDKSESALEFKEDSAGQWKSKRHGNPFGAFMETVGKSKHAMVFSDPFEFAKFKSNGALPLHGGASVLVLFGDEGSHRKLDEFLALNAHVSEVHLAHSGKPEKQENNRVLFHDLKKRFNLFDIHVKELNLADIGKERSRGPDISL